jgi:hypothetical protein
MKNHHKRPVGAAPLLEVHNIQNNVKNKKFKGSTSGGPKNKPDKRKFNKKQKPNANNKQKGVAAAVRNLLGENRGVMITIFGHLLFICNPAFFGIYIGL